MPDGSTGVLSAPSESALNNGVLEVGSHGLIQQTTRFHNQILTMEVLLLIMYR